MKVVFATGIFPPDIGGPANSVSMLAESWSARGHRVAVVTYSDSAAEGVERPYEVVRILRTQAVWKRYLSFLRAVWRASDGPGPIFAQDGVASGLPASIVARVRRRRLVLRIAGDFAWERAQVSRDYRDSLEAFQKDRRLPIGIRAARAVQRFVYRRADRVIAPSRYLVGILRGWGVRESRIRVIYNGVDLPKTAPSHGTYPRRVIAAGRLVPWKNFDALIKALSYVLQRVPDATLMIAGDGPELERLKSLADAPMLRGKVIFAGRLKREDLLRAIAESAVFALPSSYEGFSHQLVEAFACGSAVVASRAGGNAELVEDGKNGLLVEPGDAVGLSKAILRFLEDPAFAAECGREAMKDLSRFTTEAQIAETGDAVLGKPGLRVVLVSRDATAADPASRTAARMRAYGERVERLNLVCLAKAPAASVDLSPRVRVEIVDVRVDWKRPWRLLRAVEEAIGSAQANLVIAQDPFEAGLVALMAARKARVPLLVEEHGGVYLSGHWKAESLKNRLLSPLGLMVMKRAAGLRAVSAKIEDDLHRRFPRTPIVRIPVYAEPLDCFREGAPHVFGYVGRFVSEKNLETLLAAFSSVARANPEARLLMAGAGPLERSLRVRAAEYGIGDRVTWRPYNEKIVDVYKKIGTLVLSSWHEGWARVVPEAMSCGIPVVMTDVGCAGELMRDGVEGYVVSVGDKEGLTKAMMDIADKGRHGLMAAAARRRAETMPKQEDLIERVTAFWKKTAGV